MRLGSSVFWPFLDGYTEKAYTVSPCKGEPEGYIDQPL